jgi:hypothetical protein
LSTLFRLRRGVQQVFQRVGDAGRHTEQGQAVREVMNSALERVDHGLGL